MKSLCLSFFGGADASAVDQPYLITQSLDNFDI